MSIYFSGTFTRSAGLYSAIGKQLKLVNLKPVKKVVYKFDPFQPNVKSIRFVLLESTVSFLLDSLSYHLRDCMFILSSEKIQSTNPQCVFKTDIVDNCEPTLAVTLGKLFGPLAGLLQLKID